MLEKVAVNGLEMPVRSTEQTRDELNAVGDTLRSEVGRRISVGESVPGVMEVLRVCMALNVRVLGELLTGVPALRLENDGVLALLAAELERKLAVWKMVTLRDAFEVETTAEGSSIDIRSVELKDDERLTFADAVALERKLSLDLTDVWEDAGEVEVMADELLMAVQTAEWTNGELLPGTETARTEGDV